MENNDKNNTVNTTVKIGKEQLKEGREQLKQLLLNLAEERVNERGSDQRLDRENEKFKLLSGAELSIRQVFEIVSQQVRPHETYYFKNYYSEICRLRGLPLSIADNFHKPQSFATDTNEIIYSRFPKGILSVIQVKNPYVQYAIRQYTHPQLLTDEGLKMLVVFIDDAIKLMGKCSTWYEFRKRLFEEYNVPYQMDAFKEKGI